MITFTLIIRQHLVSAFSYRLLRQFLLVVVPRALVCHFVRLPVVHLLPLPHSNNMSDGSKADVSNNSTDNEIEVDDIGAAEDESSEGDSMIE